MNRSYNSGEDNPMWKGKDVSNSSGRTIICKGCGLEFTPTEYRENRIRRFCSRRCSKLGKNNPNFNGKVAVISENHPQWKGDNVGIDALHTYIRRRLPKPELCECCKEEPPYDLANISQEYKRDVSDWEWLCRKCHMNKDGRMDNLKQNSFKRT